MSHSVDLLVGISREFVSERLRERDCAIREFLSVLPQLIDDPVGLCCGLCDLCRLVRGDTKNLDSACCNFYLMIVEMSVPLNSRELSCEIFGNKIFDRDQGCFWVGGFEEKALKDLVGNAFAIVMERTPRSPVWHHVRCLNMDVVSDGWAAWFPTHGLLGGHSTTANNCHRDHG